MAKPIKFDGLVVDQVVTDEGYIQTYDKNDRRCWDSAVAVRIVLVNDLRIYGKELHIGQLGWTIPGTTDGYKAIDVEFDTGQRLSVRLPEGVSPIERIVPERANEISETLIQKYRNTRFDANCIVAEQCRQSWIHQNYGEYISLVEMTVSGEGDQELYAFTYPSLRELATLKGENEYPVKIGYTKKTGAGALQRIRDLIIEIAAYPERPVLLHIQRTWDGRDLEKQVHRNLRGINRKVAQSLGKEWFRTSKPELLNILQHCSPAPFTINRPVSGDGETFEEDINSLLAQGTTIELGMDPGSAFVRMSIKPAERNFEPE